MRREIGLFAGVALLVVAGGLVGTLRTAPVPDAEAPPVTPSAVGAVLHLDRGVNILSDDPMWQRPEGARLTAEHFRLIAEAGFDHVRINLHPFRDGALSAEGQIRERWFQSVDWAVDRALSNGLSVVLDMHEYEAMGSDPVGNQDRFLAFWRTMAARYRSAPASVAFELLNEPRDALTGPAWNELSAQAVRVVRAVDPTRTLIVGPAKSNSIKALEALRLPTGDTHLVVTVHYYLPFRFTHQGASWAGLADVSGITWTGTPAQRRAIESDFDRAQAWADQNGQRLYLGEFGAYERGDLASRTAWTSFVAREAESRGWGWAYWQFDGNFVVFDVDAGHWVAAIRDALLPIAPTAAAPADGSPPPTLATHPRHVAQSRP